MVTVNAVNDILGWAPPVVRTADKDVSTNTVVADDGVLQIDVVANELYLFEAVILYSSPAGNTTPDIKFTWVASAGTLTGAVTNLSLTTADAAQIVAGLVTATATAGTSTGKRLAVVRGWLTNSADATVKLQWAQNTSNANATRVHSGSILRWKKL